MRTLRSVLSFLSDLLYFVTGEGTWRLRPHERIVLDAAIASLPGQVQASLRAKLKQTMFVQRSHRQISRPRFYSPPYVRDKSPVGGEELSSALLNVQVEVGDKRQSAHVEFYQGRIDSIQFKYPPKFYADKSISVVEVSVSKPTLSHAAAIDRREHGKHA